MDYNKRYQSGQAVSHLNEVYPIGGIYRHFANDNLYKIIGYAWDGDKDIWTILHTDKKGELYVRSIANFGGAVGPQRKRFTEVPLREWEKL